MLFDDSFLVRLQSDPVKVTLEACDIVDRALSGGMEWTPEDYLVLMEAYALLAEIVDSGSIGDAIAYPEEPGGFSSQACSRLHQFIKEVMERCADKDARQRVKQFRSRFRAQLGNGFVYEFSQGDLERVQALINQLRDQIRAIDGIEDDHRRRLLARLEKLQSELHKRVSDLDRFWGLIGDAGVVLGKAGKNAKPIVDRIREIAEIVWQTQSRAEDLPSGTSLPKLNLDEHD